MSRIDREIEHGKAILDNAEFYWGWGTPAGKKRLERRADYLIRHADLRPGRRALELGCGKGLFTRELEKSGATIVPIDISWELLCAGRNAQSSPFGLVADAHVLPLEDRSFDAVCGVSVLHHFHVEKVLHESLRVLKPGGRLVFSEPNMLNPQILFQKNVPFIKRLLGDSPDETAFFKKGIKKTLEANGFRVVDAFCFDFLHPWTPRMGISAVDKIGKLLERIPLVREIAGSLLIVAEKPGEKRKSDRRTS